MNRRAWNSKEREARFWNFVNKGKPDDCWPWNGYVNAEGYGIFCYPYKPPGKPARQANVVASREAMRISSGIERLPSNLHVRHKCDNRQCCNPGHLHLGTAKQNGEDRTKVPRAGHKFSRELCSLDRIQAQLDRLRKAIESRVG